MNQTYWLSKRVLKCKTPITVLTLIALLCTVLSPIIMHLGFYSFSGRSLSFSYWDLISLSLTLAPKVLLILYEFKVFKKYKATIIVPIIFACVAASHLWSFIHRPSGSIFFTHTMALITTVTLTVTFTLATISALNGLSNKVFIIIPTALSLALSISSLIRLFPDFERNVILYSSYSQLVDIITSVTFNIALLLFGLKNRIPAILAVFTEKKKAEKMTLEQSLRLLKDKLDLGMLTEEEYQTQRADIISKL